MAQGKPRRNTRQRQVILEELRRLSSHPTAACLYEITRRRLPKISLGTVYRNLELLTQMGLIRKLETRGSEARYDGNISPHYHVRCVRCGRVDDVQGPVADSVMHDVKTIDGYKILRYQLEFIGICPQCTERGPKDHETGRHSGTHKGDTER